MKRLLAAFVMVLAFGGAARADDWADCSAIDPDRSIRGCTHIITAKRPTRKNLAFAYFAYVERGIAYARKADYNGAIADFDKAIQLKPDYAEAYHNRGLAYAFEGDHNRAIADFDKAIQLKPDYAEAYNYRGNAYFNKGDYDRAVTDFDKAIQLHDGYAYYGRGSAYLSKGDPAKALPDFRAAAQLIPASDQWHSQALARIAELEANLAPPPPPAAGPAPTPNGATMLAGTGIVVWAQGQVLTNNHVIEGCKEIEVRRADDTFRQAVLLYADKTNDLALLKIDAQIAEQDVASFRTTPAVRNGEVIAVYGYPLAGTLSSSGNITSGNVSALAGLADDIRFMQLTAPIQPGNSGGPLLDQSASVIGVVNMKLDEMKAEQNGGVFPQNVNFAIKASVATSFLDAHGTSYRTAAGAGSKLELPSIADTARRFTVLVVCQ